MTPTVDALGRVNRYVLAVLVVMLAFTIRLALGSVLGDTAAALLFVPAMLAASLLGGLGPSLVATALSLPLAFYLLGPRVSLDHALAQLVLLAIVGIAIGVMGRSLTRLLADARLAAQNLRRREAHLRSILDINPDATVVISAQGRIVTFNAAACGLFGYAEVEALGANVRMLLPDHRRERPARVILRYLETRLPRPLGLDRIVLGRRHDGSTFPMKVTIGKMMVENEAFFIGFIQDLTDQLRAEARLQEAQTELAHLSRVHELGEMASTLAHELNQPLSAITNFVEGCQRLLVGIDTKVAERLRVALGESAHQAIRAADIIRHMREFVARGETDKRPEDIRKLVREAGVLALTGSRVRGIKPVFDFAPGTQIVLADRVQIQQVLVNLMRNAVEAMRESKERHLLVRTVFVEENRIAVEVCDSGPGISPEVEDRLFEPFVTSKPGGMGIGLSISKRIIEAHGGEIDVRKGQGGGATFHFTLSTMGQAGDDAG